jgi:hypothetical protein
VQAWFTPLILLAVIVMAWVVFLAAMRWKMHKRPRPTRRDDENSEANWWRAPPE